MRTHLMNKRNWRFRTLLGGAGGGGGGSGELSHALHLEDDDGSVTDYTGSTGWQDVTTGLFDTSGLTSGNTYVIVARWTAKATSSGANNNLFRLTFGGTEITGSDTRHESMGGLDGEGQRFTYVGTFEADGSSKIQLQVDPNGGHIVRPTHIQMMAIDLTGAGGITVSTDDSSTALTLANTLYSTGATLDVGNGANNILLLAFARMTGGIAGNDQELLLDIDGTPKQIELIEKEDSNDIRGMGGAFYLAAPASATTCTVQGRMNATGATITHARLVAIDLDATFAEYAVSWSETGTNYGPGAYQEIMSTNIASVAATGNYGMLMSTRGLYPSSGFGAGYALEADEDGGGYVAQVSLVSVNRAEMVNAAVDQVPEMYFGKDYAATAGTSLTLRTMLDDPPATASYVNTNNLLLLWSWSQP